MTPEKQKAPTAVNSRGPYSNELAIQSVRDCDGAHKPLLKWERTLGALVDGPKNSFELEKSPGFDHCPNSTVSELKKRHGLAIVTHMIRVRGYASEGAQIAEYHLAEQSREKAVALLTRMR